MNFMEIALARQSCRSYDETRPVEEEKLTAILEAARLAPSACNGQPYHMTVCRGETAKAVAKATMGKGMNAFAAKAMEWVGAQELEERHLPQLSGGERQKVYLAMALAQDTETIFMDEPTTYLDVRHQLEVMEMAQKLAAEGKAVVAVLHDLCLALHSAHRIGVLAQGRLQALDTPDAVFRSGILDRVFGVSLGRTQTEQGWQYYYDYPQNGGAT